MVKTAKIMLVEDDECASELIYEYLQDCGFEVEPIFTATSAIAKIKNEQYDLLLLDVNLPDYDGFEVLKSIKNHTAIPIIMTSAYTDTKRKLLAFRYGADDYMTKPLDLEELEARIWLQLGKKSEIPLIQETEAQSPFVLQENEVLFEGKRIPFTTIEYEIFTFLLENKNKVISREALVERLSFVGTQRSLDNHIKNIRKKIGDNASHAKYLKTQYGVGYILAV
ncbi:response regulator transcription factor [Sulfurimonas sp.]